jgi:hypothetical protein
MPKPSSSANAHWQPSRDEADDRDEEEIDDYFDEESKDEHAQHLRKPALRVHGPPRAARTFSFDEYMAVQAPSGRAQSSSKNQPSTSHELLCEESFDSLIDENEEREEEDEGDDEGDDDEEEELEEEQIQGKGPPSSEQRSTGGRTVAEKDQQQREASARSFDKAQAEHEWRQQDASPKDVEEAPHQAHINLRYHSIARYIATLAE